MKKYEGVEVEFHVFLTSALEVGKLSASISDRFTAGTHWMEGWAGP